MVIKAKLLTFYTLAKVIYEKCNRLWKEQQRLKEVDTWSQDKLKEVADKYTQHVSSIRRCGCSRESILDFVPASNMICSSAFTSDLSKYDSIVIFKTYAYPIDFKDDGWECGDRHYR